MLMNHSSYISAIADESADLSGKMQVALVLRYFKEDTVYESFIDLSESSCLYAAENDEK